MMNKNNKQISISILLIMNSNLKVFNKLKEANWLVIYKLQIKSFFQVNR